MLWAAWLGGSCEKACLAQIQLATDRPQPHSPEESVRMIRVPQGLRVEVVASEPLLADPTDMAFDAQGRIFVCELHGYNLEGYYDILEPRAGALIERPDPAIRDFAVETVKEIEIFACSEDSHGNVFYALQRL